VIATSPNTLINAQNFAEGALGPYAPATTSVGVLGTASSRFGGDAIHATGNAIGNIPVTTNMSLPISP
jgi:hypothetical protein